MAQALKTKGQRLECTTICNVLNPTFRFPNRSIKASLAVAKAYYPWHARGTLFVGLPPPVRWTFKLCRPFMSKQQYESIGFADVGSASLLQQISADNLPAALGGTAKWSVESYVSAGVAPPRACVRRSPVLTRAKGWTSRSSEAWSEDESGGRWRCWEREGVLYK